MTNIKITICMPVASQRGGAELALMQLLQEGRDRGIDWDVVYFEEGTMVEATKRLGIPAQVITSGRLRNLPSYLRTVHKLKMHFKRNKTDIALGWMSMAHLYSGVAALSANIPSTWFQHGIPSKQSFLDRLIALIPTKIIFVCGRIPFEIQKTMVTRTPLQIIHPGVDLNKYNRDLMTDPAILRERLNLPRSTQIIGMVARLQRWKGVHTLINAMPQIVQNFPDTQCVIVGGLHSLEADYLSFLENLIIESQMSEHIKLVGYQSNPADWMQAMDIVVHGSKCEPFGMVIIEAMALGKPVVAGNEGGPTEIITDGVDGLLSEYEDHKMLADKICQLLGDHELAASLSEKAQERAQNFSTEKYATRLIECILKYGLSSADKLGGPVNTEAAAK